MTAQHRPFSIDECDYNNPSIAVQIEGPSGLTSDYIRVESLQGQESISQPFQLTLELRADDVASASGKMLDASVIGQWACISLAQHNDDSLPPSYRYLRGLVTEVALGAPGCYTLTVQSPLQVLSLRNRYHIYTDCDVQTLLNQVFAQELQDTKFKLRFDFDSSLTLTRTQDWMQAGETDLEFIQRILGKCCVHYFFIHEQNLLTLVFSNSVVTQDKVAIPGHSSGPLVLRYTYTSVEKLGSQQADLFCDLRYAIKMMPGKVSAMLTRQEAVWEQNPVAAAENTPWLSHGNNVKTEYQHHRCYDYGANTDEDKGQLTKICQQIETEAGTLTGTVTSSLLSPGYCFTLSDPLLDDDDGRGTGRPEFSGEIFVVTKIQHKMSASGFYSGQVEATMLSLSEDEYQHTLLTPFNIQNTRQGSILAKVLDHEKPSGWRYRSKSNFQPERGQTSFDNEPYHERGCLVELVTGEQHWVALPRTSQTVPEVNSLVMIGRGGNESEQPELQQVLSSHGSKTIMPPDRRNASWQTNTHWGSNYSTSYGDGISIRYGHNSATNLPQAIQLVESAYDNADIGGGLYGNSSYSKGGGWSLSQSDNADVGILSASVSQGSSYNESHAKVSYSVTNTGTSQNYSKVGKSVSRSVIGEYDGSVDLNSPSFVAGKLPDQSIVSLANQLGNGDSYNENHIKGRSVSLSGTDMPPPGWGDKSATVYSSSQTLGKVVNKNVHIGDSDSTSLQVGNSQSVSTTVGTTDNVNTFVGLRNDINTSLSATNAVSTTIGASNSITTNASATNSVSTTVGLANSVDTFVGARNSLSTNLSATNSTSTTIGVSNSTETFIGAKNVTSTSLAATNTTETFIGARNHTSTTLAATNTTETFLGATNTTSTRLALNNSNSVTMGVDMSNAVNLSSSISNKLSMGAVISNDINLAVGVNTVLAPFMVNNDLTPKAKTSETTTEILLGIYIIL
ncbi:hypothetical protein CHH28_14640 [Bacterioplanes sanyensis]|uniref:Gp5/Type VI secretion system Vgr protein OB-fold domain-containing protein n=1 Tax=Bacterioplanes sanyensis TaxID=1249553 RepID=A0A222FMT6_9GAMM|nr:contractile injection system protein, VgrG/Pvc8 family [Bacterioplanes sanyensis]ASP39834.1 hypothetical protein CHH28_14640 [Bacterioplanes sanyensis]